MRPHRILAPEPIHDNKILSALVAALVPSVPCACAELRPPPPKRSRARRSFRARRCSAIRKRPRRACRPMANTFRSSRRETACSTCGLAERGNLDAAKPITNDQQARHPPALLGIRQPTRAVHPGRRRRRELAPVCRRRGRRHDQGPHALQRRRAAVAGLSWKKPGVVAVALNDRVPEWHDLWEVDLATGKRMLIEQNSQEFAGYDLDLDLKPKLAQKNDADGAEIFRRVGGKWVSLLKYRPGRFADHRPLGIEARGKTALLQSSVGRDKAALVRVDIATGKTTVLGASEQADVEDGLVRPEDAKPQAYTVNYLKPEITVLNPAVKKDVDLLTKKLGDGFSVTNRTLDDSIWTVATDDALAPAIQLSLRPQGRQGHQAVRPAPGARQGAAGADAVARAQGARRPHARVLSIAAAGLGCQWRRRAGYPRADGAQRARRPVGPRHLRLRQRAPVARESRLRRAGGELPRLHRLRQELRQRGQQGVGRQDARRPARRGRLGGRREDHHQDKVAIYGGSYGGYATLVGLTFTPDTFACGVDIVGPSNLNTLVSQSIPPYWKSFLRGVRVARRRSAHRRGQEAARRALAAHACGRDQEAAADRRRAPTTRA